MKKFREAIGMFLFRWLSCYQKFLVHPPSEHTRQYYYDEYLERKRMTNPKTLNKGILCRTM